MARARSGALAAVCAAALASVSALERPIRRVGIVGAGPAGLTQAIALRHFLGDAVDVTVFDRADQLRPSLGGGVQLNSGAAVLARLGLGEALKACGEPARRVRGRNAAGDTLLDLDLEAAIRASPGAAAAGLVDAAGDVLALTVMRDELERVLAEAAGPKPIVPNERLVGLEALPGGCACLFASGRREEFDLVIGADGIRSEARRAVLAEKGGGLGTFDTGIRIQWGIAPGGSRAGPAGELHQWFGPGAYCLEATYGGAGGARFDQCVVVHAAEGQAGAEAGGMNPNWDTADVRGAMAARLRAAGLPAHLEALAQKCERCFELRCYTHNPLVPWVGLGGRAVLVGDAAHAMPPFLGQGTNQAVQDAYLLAKELAALRDGSRPSLEAALSAYTRARLPAVARLVASSRLLGVVETALPPLARDTFFRTTGALGVAKAVFLDGATPKV